MYLKKQFLRIIKNFIDENVYYELVKIKLMLQ